MEIYLNNGNETNIVKTLDKRERWVANYILTNKKIKAKDIELMLIQQIIG